MTGNHPFRRPPRDLRQPQLNTEVDIPEDDDYDDEDEWLDIGGEA